MHLSHAVFNIPVECIDMKLLRVLLHEIQSELVKRGPSNAMQHVQRLRQLIREHAELFTTLYAGHEKPKFHHLFHIVDNMLFLGKLLS